MSEAVQNGWKKLATVDLKKKKKKKTRPIKAVRDPKRYTHGLSQQNLVPGAVTKGNGVQGRELWKKKREISDHGDFREQSHL